MDFQKLNATTKNDFYPMPLTKKILDMVAKHEVYLFLDGFSSYYQITIASEDKKKIAFITNWGAFL
jgi:hypothetical protein